MEDVQTVRIGEEYDEGLFAKCSAWLAARNARLLEKLQGVAGSQDVSCWKYLVDEQVIEIEAETYIGLTVKGPSSVVNQLAAEIVG